MTALGKLLRTTAIKMALVYFVAFAGLAIFLVVYIADSTDGILARQLDQSINDESASLVEQFATNGLRGLVTGIEMRSRRPSAGLYLVTDFAGRTMVGNIADLPLELLAQADGQPIHMKYRRLDEDAEGKGKDYQAVVEVFRLPGGFRLVVGRDTSERAQFRDAIASAFQVIFGVVLGLGLLSYLFVRRSVLKRIDGISETSRQIMSGDLTRRLEVTGSGDEFDRLAISLNDMLARIEQLMQGLKEVSDNIAHDLKTPLTRMRGRLEDALRRYHDQPELCTALSATLEDNETLIETFEALLRIARLEAGSLEEEGAEVDMSALLAELGELYEPVAEEEGASLAVKVEPGLRGRASRTLVTQALANLIDNALKYGLPSEGGVITLSASRTPDGLVLSVADNGAGIAAQDRERVLARFVRLDNSRTRPGSGLGLALVAAVAHIHKGRIELGDAEPGLVVRLILPVAAG